MPPIMVRTHHLAGFVVTLAAALLLLTTAAIGRPPPTSPSVDEARRRAKAAFSEQRYEEALKWLRYAHTHEPSATYAFNMGRTLTELGRYREAHAAFLTALAQSDLRPEHRTITEARIRALKPLMRRAVIRLRGLPAGTAVQIDGVLIPDTAGDRRLDPGAHQLCLLAESGSVRCWRRDLLAGLRVDWPPKTGEASRGSLQWDGDPSVQRLVLDGHALHIPVGVSRRIEVDIGAHELRVERAGEASCSVRLELSPKQRLAATCGPPSPTGSTGASAWSWVGVGTSAAVAAAGAAVLIVAAVERSDQEALEAPGSRRSGVVQQPQADAKAAWDRIDTLNVAGGVVLGVGLAGLAGTLTWALLERSSGRGEVTVSGGARVGVGFASPTHVVFGATF